MFTKQNFAIAGVLTLLALTAPHPATAQVSWQYSIFNGPAASTFYQPDAINNAGIIAGTYSSSTSSGVFLMQGGTFTTFGNGDTQLNGINNAGDTTGYFYDAVADVETPFVRGANGTFSFLPKLVYGDVPQALNDTGKVVGYSTDDFTTVHGAMWSGGIETTSDYPGASDTAYYGINNAGKIVGDTNNITGNGPPEAFVLDNGVFTPFVIPGADVTIAEGINNADQILGRYGDANGSFHGFILNNGIVTTLDFPDLDALFGLTFTDSNGKLFNRQRPFTIPLGFNDKEDFVGIIGASYEGADGTGFFFREHGFIATAVPEPDSIALLVSMSVTGVAFVMRRRKVRTA